jgi:hypothetical protein
VSDHINIQIFDFLQPINLKEKMNTITVVDKGIPGTVFGTVLLEATLVVAIVSVTVIVLVVAVVFLLLVGLVAVFLGAGCFFSLTEDRCVLDRVAGPVAVSLFEVGT